MIPPVRPVFNDVLSGLAEEEAVSAGSLVDGEECWISNGVRGFIHGQVRLSA